MQPSYELVKNADSAKRTAWFVVHRLKILPWKSLRNEINSLIRTKPNGTIFWKHLYEIANRLNKYDTENKRSLNKIDYLSGDKKAAIIYLLYASAEAWEKTSQLYDEVIALWEDDIKQVMEKANG